MRWLALIEAAGHVCYRYRLAAFRSHLVAQGIEIEPRPLARGSWAQWRQFADLGNYDGVIVQRRLLSWVSLARLRREARAVLFDFDDAVYQRDSYARKGPRSVRRLFRFWATLYFADGVIAGNHYLAGRAADWVGPEKVTRIPTCVEPLDYPSAHHRGRGTDVRMVWIGQRSTLPSLEQAGDALAAAAGASPGIKLRVVSDCFPQLPGVDVERRTWDQTSEVRDLATGDIGVSWLPDDAWSRGKCGLKVLQYMAAGLPVVANPIGMHNELIAHGRTGYLAQTPAEWADAIRRLAGDPQQRAKLGAAGRERVEREYSVVRWGAELAAALRRASRAAVTNALPPDDEAHRDPPRGPHLRPARHPSDEVTA